MKNYVILYVHKSTLLLIHKHNIINVANKLKIVENKQK